MLVISKHLSQSIVTPFCPSFIGRGGGREVADLEFNFLLVLKPARMTLWRRWKFCQFISNSKTNHWPPELTIRQNQSFWKLYCTKSQGVYILRKLLCLGAMKKETVCSLLNCVRQREEMASKPNSLTCAPALPSSHNHGMVNLFGLKNQFCISHFTLN